MTLIEVNIIWVDAQSHYDWKTTDEIEFSLRPMISRGYLIKENQAKIIISHTYDPQNNRWCDPIEIPKSAIRKITRKRRTITWIKR